MLRITLALLLLASAACSRQPRATGVALLAHASAAAGAPSVTTPPIDATGATLLVAAVSTWSTTSAQLTDSNSNNWTPLLQPLPSGGASSGQLFISCNPKVSANQTAKFTDTYAVYPSLALLAYSGIACPALDAQSGAYGPYPGTTKLQPGSITTSAPGELLITVLADAPTATPSIDSGFSIIEQRNVGPGFGLAVAQLIQSTAGPLNPTWTPGPQRSGSASISATIAAFKVAGPPPAPQATQTINSGATPLPTTAIAPGACDSPPLTVSAPGTLATDALELAPASNAAAAGYGVQGFNLSWYVSPGSVSFIRCNVTTASKAPGLLTLNWRVLR